MSISGEKICLIIGGLISDRLNILAIFADQKDAPLPPSSDGPFATCKILARSSEGLDAEIYSPSVEYDGLDETLKGRRRITASIQFYRNESDFDKTAVEMAEEFKTYLQSSEAMLEFSKNEMGLITVSDPIDLTEVDVETFEGRSSIDIEMYVSYELTTHVLDIDEVRVQGEVENTPIDDIDLIITE